MGECRVERRVVSSNKRGNMVFMRKGVSGHQDRAMFGEKIAWVKQR